MQLSQIKWEWLYRSTLIVIPIYVVNLLALTLKNIYPITYINNISNSQIKMAIIFWALVAERKIRGLYYLGGLQGENRQHFDKYLVEDNKQCSSTFTGHQQPNMSVRHYYPISAASLFSSEANLRLSCSNCACVTFNRGFRVTSSTMYV